MKGRILLEVEEGIKDHLTYTRCITQKKLLEVNNIANLHNDYILVISDRKNVQ